MIWEAEPVLHRDLADRNDDERTPWKQAADAADDIHIKMTP